TPRPSATTPAQLNSQGRTASAASPCTVPNTMTTGQSYRSAALAGGAWAGVSLAAAGGSEAMEAGAGVERFGMVCAFACGRRAAGACFDGPPPGADLDGAP